MNTVQRLLDALGLHSFAKWMVLASLVGIVAGLGAIAFDVIGQGVVRYSLAQFAGYTPPEAAGEHVRFEHQSDFFSPWMIVAVMTAGGLISGVIVYGLAPEAEGPWDRRRDRRVSQQARQDPREDSLRQDDCVCHYVGNRRIGRA